MLRLDLLQSGIKAINSAIELDDLLTMIVNNAVRVLNAEQSTIGLVDELTGNLVIRCATGIDSSQLKGRSFLPGVGVAGWVVQHGQPALIQDVFADTRYINLDTGGLTGRSTRSMLGTPLIIEHKVIGVLCVTHSLPNALSEEDQRLITSFAEQAALAVYKSQLLAERTRQRNELRRRKELISSLNLVTRSVLSSLDLPQVLNTISSRMVELFSLDHAFIYLRDTTTGELTMSALGGMDLYPLDLEKEVNQQVMGWWANTHQSRVMYWRARGMSLLCFRLVNESDALGYILLVRDETRPFREEERDAIRKLADAATIAIVKARLFGQVRAQQEQTAALYRLMRRISEASDRKELAQVVCSELKQITGAKSAALLMEDSEQAQITVWAAEGKWSIADASGIALPLRGDPFISSALTALIKAEPLDLVLIPNVPQQFRAALDSTDAVTIPLSGTGRIFGLLIVEPDADLAATQESKEMVRLAISQIVSALERAELFEGRMRSMGQSNMLYSIATRVQASLEASSVVDMTLQGALKALPIRSCELYLLEDDGIQLRRHGKAVAPDVDGAMVLCDQETVSLASNPVLFEVLHSPGLTIGDFSNPSTDVGPNAGDGAGAQQGREAIVPVVLARLMSSDKPVGVVRFTTVRAPEEFVLSYTTFCKMLLTYASGALERSRLYSDLVDSKREIETVVLSMSNGVLVTDAALNVIISNDLADRLLGIPASQPGRNGQRSLAEIIDRAELLDMMRDCVAHSRLASTDLELTIDGELRAYEAGVYPIPGTDGRDVFGAVLTLRDVTVEHANEKAKSDFLSMISHELRTPLNSIYGFLDITLSGKTGPLTDLQNDFLNTAKQEAVVLRRLISDLIDYSRLESRALSLEMEPLDLSQVVGRAIRSASARMEADQLSITIGELPEHLLVVGDEVRLQQVFDNLLDNAAKFTDPGGEIALSCALDGPSITISVTDNGVGIPPSQIDAIFDRFFQADNHSSRRKRGQGLGLAICKHLVETHGGRIWAESTPGVGTTMYVELPLFTPDASLFDDALLAEPAPAGSLVER